MNPRHLDSSEWFTELADEAGLAMSLRHRGRLHSEQSPYQKIEVYDTEGFGHLMVIDGYVMLSERDNFVYHEMLSHPVLLTHPRPRRVVIIGGGDCGTLREVLKHPEVTQVTQVDIDERVTRVAERFFPELCESNHDPRAELLFEDGVAWMAAAADESADVVIVDSTDPVGPGEGLFNESFYRECRRVLGAEGLLVQQSESPLIHLDLIQAMRAAMSAAGFGCLHTLQFPQPVYPSGWWSATMARARGPWPEFRAGDARKLRTRYYSAAVHQGALAMPPFFGAATGQSDEGSAHS